MKIFKRRPSMAETIWLEEMRDKIDALKAADKAQRDRIARLEAGLEQVFGSKIDGEYPPVGTTIKDGRGVVWVLQMPYMDEHGLRNYVTYWRSIYGDRRDRLAEIRWEFGKDFEVLSMPERKEPDA